MSTFPCLHGSNEEINSKMMNSSNQHQEIKNLAASIDHFTSSLFQEMVIGTNENVFMSPFSVATILSMVYLGAKQISAEHLKNVLNVTSTPNDLALAYKKYFSVQKNSNEANMSKSVNRLYVEDKFPVSESYKHKILEYFFTDVKNVDFFKNAERIRIDINKWVKNETYNKITDLLPSKSLSSDTVLLLVNAMHFEGMWAARFPERVTSSREFHLSSGKTVSCDSMFISEDFNTKISQNYKAVELPYMGVKFSMFVILSNKMDGLAALEKEINAQFLKETTERKGFERLSLELYLPKFHFQSAFELSDTLQKLGLSDIFDASKANLSGISSEKDLYVSKFFHKTFIDVNEKGTDAHAASGEVVINPVSAQTGTKFDVNHPFIFLIADRRTKLIYFIGKVTNPAA
ncbi:leukocyte elastase inhibitor isoform X2 [Octopus sinensis]|uniref:Leukocyte elastase inhibitor isoform X2 n=1 Tax=Octopus sinensis TaxID=2607531 RepID=A0A6P7TAR7_9MOLL|nr:leukocyte elastase inhibitor isoform X2 [Octopus sinensis]XP_036366992.1 leukocyte elastase inhibitor isoform X2 [Octopus sinensis]